MQSQDDDRDDSETIRFGEFVLNRARGCVEDATGAERFLRPKSYSVLEFLVERRGNLISKDELVRQIWPDVIVSDDSLAHCVSDIRRALRPEGAGLLRTVPRRGYMLANEDALSEDTHPPDQDAAGTGTADPDTPGSGMADAYTPDPGSASPVIASPFIANPVIANPVIANAGAPDPDTALARAGALVTALVVVAALAVSGWSYMMPGDKPEHPPDSTRSTLQQADALLETRDWRQREHNDRARVLLEALVEKEPLNVDAWASLGLTYWLEVQHIAWGGGRREMEQALVIVEHSIALGGSARPHRLLSEMRLLAPFQEMRSPVDALASARAAVAIDPEDPDNLAVLAQVLALTGRSEEAVRMIAQALSVAPRSPDWYRQVAGLSYLLAGEPARAAEEFGILYGAGTFTSSRWWPGWLFAASLAHAGRIDEASAIVRTAHGRQPERSIASVAQSFDGFADPAGLAIVLEGLKLAGMPG